MGVVLVGRIRRVKIGEGRGAGESVVPFHEDVKGFSVYFECNVTTSCNVKVSKS